MHTQRQPHSGKAGGCTAAAAVVVSFVSAACRIAVSLVVFALVAAAAFALPPTFSYTRALAQEEDAFSFPISERGFVVVPASRPPLKAAPTEGDQLAVIATIQGRLEEPAQATYVVQIIDSETGFTESIHLKNVTLAREFYTELQGEWEPARAGTFAAEAFVLSGSQGPELPSQHPLAEKMSSGSVTVGSRDHSVNGNELAGMVNVSHDPGSSVSPLIATSGDRIYVVWTDRAQHGSADSRILFSRSTDRGETFERPVPIASVAPGEQYQKQLAAAPGTDNVYVAWSSRAGQGPAGAGGPYGEIFFSRSVDGGGTFGSEPVVLSSGNGTATNPVLATTAAADLVHVLWQEKKNGGGGQDVIMFRSSRDRGASFGPAFSLSSAGATAVNPGMAVSAENGNIYAVWHERNGTGSFVVLFSRSTDNGATFEEPALLSGNASYLVSQIAASGDSVYVTSSISKLGVFGNRTIVSSDVVLFSSVDAGATFEEPVSVSSGPNNAAGISLIAGGAEAYLLYGEDVPGRTDTYFARGSDGKPFRPMGSDNNNKNNNTSISNGNSSSSVTTPISGISMAVHGENVYLLWNDESRKNLATAPASKIYLTISTDRGETFAGGTVNLAVSNGLIFSPRIAVMEQDGTICILWQDAGYRDNNEILFTRSVDGGRTFHEGVEKLPAA